MYCPNCAAPIEGVKFCRSCGANVSLVPQALSGELPVVSDEEHGGRRRKRKGEKPPTIEKAATTFFTGIGFILASLMVMRHFPGGVSWGWSLLIPGFVCIGEGVGQYLRLKEEQRQQQFQPQSQQPQFQAPYSPPAAVEPNLQPKTHTPEISAPTTSELTPPKSITEHTTKNLDVSRERE